MTATQELTYEQLLEENKSLKNEIRLLVEQLKNLKKMFFGKRSEKLINKNENQLEFDGFSNLEEDSLVVEDKEIPAHTRRTIKRNGQDKIIVPENIPIQTTVIDIAEDKTVSSSGGPLVKIGEEVTDKLAFQPGSYFIKRTIRPKYTEKGAPENGIFVEALPSTLLNRCFADESFLADIMVKKYADHLPFYRQCEILKRIGIVIPRQHLCKWLMRAALQLKPLHTLMKNKILESRNAFVDETPVKLLTPGKGKTTEAYVWVLAGGKSKDPPYRVFNFFENRRHCNVKMPLGDYSGTLHSDKYGAYESLANERKIIWCPCWAHIRRYFFEAESGDPEFRKWILMKIRHLYMFDRVAWNRSPDERLKIRQEKEVPIIDELIEGVKKRLTDGVLLPKSNFKKALSYFYGLVPYLKNYTNDPFAHIDNNVAERTIRPLAIGRKNWLFFGSEDGGEAASIVYTLVQTCRSLGINPHEYLEDVMRRIMDHNINELEQLLPDRWAEEKGIIQKKL